MLFNTFEHFLALIKRLQWFILYFKSILLDVPGIFCLPCLYPGWISCMFACSSAELSSYSGCPASHSCFCCPFLDVLSCFAALCVVQYLFGSAACPILRCIKIKQRRWPLEEHLVSFYFCSEWKQRERERAASSTIPQRTEGSFFFFFLIKTAHRFHAISC